MNCEELLIEQAPVFSGLRCIRFARFNGGPIPVIPGDKLICTVEKEKYPTIRVEQEITKTMLLEYVGIYEIENYGGIAGMFFERRELTIKP